LNESKGGKTRRLSQSSRANRIQNNFKRVCGLYKGKLKLFHLNQTKNELTKKFLKLGKSISFRKSIISNGTFELYQNGSLSVPSDVLMIWHVKLIFFQNSKSFL
jgi:hypothetical protein